jgi:hypothetical protein
MNPLATFLGRPAARPAPSLPASRAPSAQARWAGNRLALKEFGDAFLRRGAAGGDALGMVVFAQPDLGELLEIFGVGAARGLVSGLEEKLADLAGSRGLALRTDKDLWVVLLPCRSPEHTLAAIRDAFDGTYAVPVDTDDEDIVLVPDFVVRTLAGSDVSVAQAYEEARRRISRTRAAVQAN